MIIRKGNEDKVYVADDNGEEESFTHGCFLTSTNPYEYTRGERGQTISIIQ